MEAHNLLGSVILSTWTFSKTPGKRKYLSSVWGFTKLGGFCPDDLTYLSTPVAMGTGNQEPSDPAVQRVHDCKR